MLRNNILYIRLFKPEIIALKPEKNAFVLYIINTFIINGKIFKIDLINKIVETPRLKIFDSPTMNLK